MKEKMQTIWRMSRSSLCLRGERMPKVTQRKTRKKKRKRRKKVTAKRKVHQTKINQIR